MRRLLSVRETARYLRIPLPTVYYLVQRGQLPAIQIGGRWRIKKWELDPTLNEKPTYAPTVLVVTGDKQLQSGCKLFFEHLGFSPLVAGTVKEALTALGEAHFGLLFVDPELPDGPVNTLCAAARRINPKMWIMVITDDRESDMLKRIMADSRVGVFSKKRFLRRSDPGDTLN